MGVWKLPTKKQFFMYQETDSGVFGLFDEPSQILEAARKTKAKNYEGFDCLTPYPIHGIDEAMGLARSGIPWISFIMGLFGCTMAFGYQYLTHAHDWQLNIAGKAWNAWPAFIPITFEGTIFFAGVLSVFSLIFLAKLTKPNRKILHPDITNHRFALWIPSSAPGYKEEEVINFMNGLGAKEVTVVK
ncbi:MAG: DUF3341 domain-containing protein [Leptospiraceae bacterium]|nr:DUF3341 domain-containing protein [Leptospiraceae bacterium]MCP5494473.1 DUF3341 domain-containing protein [Leptospiraceae bacterium]